MMDKARLNAYTALKRINEGAYSNLVMPKELYGVDRAFAERIILGVLERKITLEYVISLLVKQPPSTEVNMLLSTGIYQILYMDRVPDNAACDETVSIAKGLFGTKTAGFVNAVLRNLCRSKGFIANSIENAEPYIKHSINKELYALINQQYPAECDKIFEAFFNLSPTYLRVNCLKTNAQSVAEAVDGRVINGGCVATSNTARALELINGGCFYIQGRASQEAVRILDAKPGHRVVDVCACPGGKSLGAAIDMENKGEIFSFDLHRNKLSLIEKSSSRLGISIITAQQRNATHPITDMCNTADRVICDVPCSGTGVIGAKPEIRYKNPNDFMQLYVTQRKIINNAAKYLKPGGIMVYSTCSINKIENQEVVCEFLKCNDGFSLEFEKTFLPFEEANEGFYVAKIIREK